MCGVKWKKDGVEVGGEEFIRAGLGPLMDATMTGRSGTDEQARAGRHGAQHLPTSVPSEIGQKAKANPHLAQQQRAEKQSAFQHLILTICPANGHAPKL